MDHAAVYSAPRFLLATFVLPAVLIGSLTGAAAAKDVIDTRTQPARASSGQVVPWHQRSMNPSMRARLTAAFELALTRVQELPACGGLFAALGADGAEVLSATLYFPAPGGRNATTCRNAAAYSFVGEAPTFLCSEFGSLTDQHAALVLVHEALHHAGLTERPSDPLALSSVVINEKVRKACGFQVMKKANRPR